MSTEMCLPLLGDAIDAFLVLLCFRPTRLVATYSQPIFLLAQREQIGFALSHRTLETEQDSQLPRSFSGVGAATSVGESSDIVSMSQSWSGDDGDFKGSCDNGNLTGTQSAYEWITSDTCNINSQLVPV